MKLSGPIGYRLGGIAEMSIGSSGFQKYSLHHSVFGVFSYNLHIIANISPPLNDLQKYMRERARTIIRKHDIDGAAKLLEDIFTLIDPQKNNDEICSLRTELLFYRTMSQVNYGGNKALFISSESLVKFYLKMTTVAQMCFTQ